MGRRAIRVCDLADPKTLAQRLEDLLSYHNAFLSGWGEPKVEKEPLYQALLEIAPRLLSFAAPVSPLLEEADRQGERLLFEGAQAVLLDVDHGTYPFVTSSHTAAGQASLGSGLGAATQATVVGICKAYTTRVGQGPFPTELFGPAGEILRERGREYGVNTGRPRRCGWFDATLVRHSIQVGGIHSLALTKLDILDGLPEVRIGTGYRINGQFAATFPAGFNHGGEITPVYETLPGWQESTAGIRDFQDLPAAARAYVLRIEALTKTEVTMISTSPQREDTIILKSPFAGR